MKRDDLSAHEYSLLIELLRKGTFSRKIIDWTHDGQHAVQYDLLVIPLIREQPGMNLIELRLYADAGKRYNSYLIASHDGRKHTYQIKDEALVAELIAALENLAIFTK